MKKRGQLQISFSMIFSIILIVVFIAVAVYGIVKFLGIQECAETGLFKQDLQTSIDKAWSSDSSYEIFPKNNPITLPKKIDYICFIDLGKESKGSHSDYYSSFKSEGLTNHNMFFSPITEACSGQGSFEIKHINIVKITENENPYCIANDKIEMKIEKAFGENLVSIKKSTDSTNTDESSGNSGGSSNTGGSSGITGFCGTSSLASCNLNSDCKTGGCSGQVCEGKNENLVTTCEWKDCYKEEDYGVACKCVSGKCKWD